MDINKSKIMLIRNSKQSYKPKSKKGFTLLIIFLVLPFIGFSQFTVLKINHKANIAYMNKEYPIAIKLFDDMNTKEKYSEFRSEIKILKGICHKEIGGIRNLKKAKQLLNPNKNKKINQSLLFLEYAQTLQMLEELDSALANYQKYLFLNPFSELAQKGINECNFSIKTIETPSLFEVSNFTYNSRFNDYAPCFYSNKLLFTSSRKGGDGKNINKFSGEFYSGIYSLDIGSKLSKPILLSSIINTKAEEADQFFFKNEQELYFSRREIFSKKNSNPVYNIFYSEMVDQEWLNPKIVEIYSDNKFNMISPFKYGNKLYFSSDMNGGYGGYDLWYIELNEDKKSNPVNLGIKINTNQDDVYPYFNADGTFYFSSNGHLGMGGLDIFKVVFDEKDNVVSLENMMNPINSTANDFGIIFDENYKKGYFSSNRVGSKGYDIYFFNIAKY